MKELILPLVESLISSYVGPDFSKVKIIGVQHILETTHSMFRSLYKLGLKPENVSLIGKCYSTCREVYEEMRADGIDVSPGSFSYASHQPFDKLFEAEIQSFLSKHLEDLSADKYEKIIVLDDGGKCISFLSQHLSKVSNIIGIEQTSSGYHAIRSIKLPFPVINIARSPLKLRLESPMIAEAAAERLFMSLQKKEIVTDRALIIGGGAIGKAMLNKLSTKLQVTVYDRETHLSTEQFSDFPSLISNFPLIIGCTGQTTIPKELHSQLSRGTALVSVSSSDREFDAVHLRNQIPENDNCHSDLIVNGLVLVNSGFPVNFDGGRENIEPELIQLTIALITAGVLEALSLVPVLVPALVELNKNIESTIQSEFLKLIPV